MKFKINAQKSFVAKQMLFGTLLTLLYMLFSCNSKPAAKTINLDEGNPVVSTLIKSEKDISNIKVGYCTPSLNAPYYVALKNNIQETVESYGMKFVSADGQDDITKQIIAVEDLVTSGINILILNPLDPKAMVRSANAATKAGVTVFIVDSYIDPSASYISYVQADNEGNGKLLGEWVASNMGNTPIKAALISGSQGNPVGMAKRLGFIEGLAETQLRLQGKTNMDIAAQGWGNWTNNGGIKAMEDILVAHPDINLLVAENDAMGIGALKAINEAGKASNVTIVSFDGQKEAYELIMKGKYGATALNSPSLLGRLVVESVVKYLNGEENEKVTCTSAVIITKENVDKFYDPDAIF